MDILQLVDRLEALVNRGRHIPFTASVLINEDEFLEIVDQIRIAIPEDIKSAKRMQQERNRILAEAQEEADRIIEDSRRQVSEMIEEHQLVEAAKARAEQILRQSEDQAVAMRQGADEYVSHILTNLDSQLTDIQQVVRNGIASVGTDTRPGSDTER